jgi:hypothetical protein
MRAHAGVHWSDITEVTAVAERLVADPAHCHPPPRACNIYSIRGMPKFATAAAALSAKNPDQETLPHQGGHATLDP